MEQHAVGVVAIIVKKRAAGAPEVNRVLTEFGDIVLGRMGLPYAQRDLHIITLIVDATPISESISRRAVTKTPRNII